MIEAFDQTIKDALAQIAESRPFAGSLRICSRG